MNIHLSSDFAGDQLFWPNVVRAIGQALVLAPLTSIAMVGIARHQSAAASGIFNMLRNLGGAFGTAILATIITKREQYHSNIIGTAVRLSRDTVRARIDQMAGYFSAHGTIDPAEARHQAVIAIGNIVHRQSLIMGFSDTFAVLGILVFAAAAIVMMTKGGAPGSATVH
jgi:MFS transporter, DHA2 family, multidrug resistance protein